MKKLLLAAGIFATVSTIAVATPIAQPVSTQIQEKEEVQIDIEALPDPVKKTIEESYAEWTPQTAYKIEKDKGVFYKVEFVQGEEKATVKFNAAGEVMKEKSKDDLNVMYGAFDQEETPIKIEELPDPVKKTIADNYGDWTPVAAFKTPSEEGDTFRVDFTQGEKKASVRFDADGKVIE